MNGSANLHLYLMRWPYETLVASSNKILNNGFYGYSKSLFLTKSGITFLILWECIKQAVTPPEISYQSYLCHSVWLFNCLLFQQNEQLAIAVICVSYFNVICVSY
jgi:hypothetical protein